MSLAAKQICLITALITLVIYFYGVLVTITSIEKNECKMTYMFEYPQFVVSLLIKSFFVHFLEFALTTFSINKL